MNAPAPITQDTSIHTATIRQLVAEATARHPEAAGRIARAAMSVTLGTIEREGTGFSVESGCEPGKRYHVEGTRCTCPDHVYRNVICRHAWAVGMLCAATRREAEGTAIPTYVRPALACSPEERFLLTPQGEAYLATRTRYSYGEVAA